VHDPVGLHYTEVTDAACAAVILSGGRSRARP
jgi:hypothetical protein